MIFSQKIKLSVLVLLLVFATAFPFAKAMAFDFEKETGINDTGKEAGYTEVGLSDVSPAQLIGEIIGTILTFIGVFFLLLSIYSGFIWMFSRGNEQDIEYAKKTLQNAIIGLIIVLLAYAVTYFIIEIFFSVESPEKI